jgi:hypothetical protein
MEIDKLRRQLSHLQEELEESLFAVEKSSHAMRQKERESYLVRPIALTMEHNALYAIVLTHPYGFMPSTVYNPSILPQSSINSVPSVIEFPTLLTSLYSLPVLTSLHSPYISMSRRPLKLTPTPR